MAAGIWVRVMKDNRMARSETQPCARIDWLEALDEVCRRMDLQRPVLLRCHERDWDSFGLTRFLPEHFMESVDFDRMDVQFIDPDKKKKRGGDFPPDGPTAYL